MLGSRTEHRSGDKTEIEDGVMRDKEEIQLMWDGYLVGGFIKAAPLDIVLRQFWSELTGGEMLPEGELDKIAKSIDRYPPHQWCSYKLHTSIGTFVATHMNSLNNWLYRMMDKKKDKEWIIDQVNRSGIKAIPPSKNPTTRRQMAKKDSADRRERLKDQQDRYFDPHEGFRRRDWNVCK